MRRGFFGSVLLVVYVIVGIVAAADRHYFTHISTLQAFVSAVLAVLLWPLLFAGVSLHIH